MKPASQRRFSECDLSLKKNDAQNLSFRDLHVIVRGQRISTDITDTQRIKVNGSIVHTRKHMWEYGDLRICGNMRYVKAHVGGLHHARVLSCIDAHTRTDI